MRNLVTWLVVIVLAWLAWAEGWPWLRAQLERTGAAGAAAAAPAGGSEAGRCLAVARQAVDTFGERSASFSPQRDVDAWMRFGGQVQARIGQARDACGCIEEACSIARGAMDDLASLVDRMDAVVRGASEQVVSSAYELDAIYGELDRAARTTG
jgi:hypothetical protein